MKKIKFRAWDKINKMMFKKVQVLNLRPDKNEVRVMPRNLNFKHSGVISIAHSIIMQFIGLKDKKGKEIYEDDIVSFYPYELSKQRHKKGWLIHGRIVFNDNAQFCIRYVDMFEPDGEIDYLFTKECEVIGNIYENPDLLTFEKTKGT